MGEDRVGMGSDYDGAIVPQDVTTCADLPNLREAMAAHGYDDALMTKLCHGNWLRVLEKPGGITRGHTQVEQEMTKTNWRGTTT